MLRYYDALVGLMRDGGFSYDLAHHALHALGWCDDQTEFEFGLDVILDGLDRIRQST